MSPEHARGEQIDARADVFAAGIVLWELASGRRLYKVAEGGPTLLDQARKADIPELVAADLPASALLRRIVSKALAVDRDARYPSASAMQRDLQEYAVSGKLMTSPLELGEWLTKTFGLDIVAQRRTRERAAAAWEKGPAVVLEPVEPPSAAAFDLSPQSTPLLLVQKSERRPKAPMAIFAVMVIMTLVAVVVALAAR
jgi:serine/threonine-protein kinase